MALSESLPQINLGVQVSPAALPTPTPQLVLTPPSSGEIHGLRRELNSPAVNRTRRLRTQAFQLDPQSD
ncbi:hypothetical protein TNCV_4898891 [Trichonephila clavipes]|nr:hypothetical protein TNCV_4898891 [Trichonephila clavipes]